MPPREKAFSNSGAVGGLLITILMAFFSMMANFSFFLFQSAVLLLFLVF